MKSFTISCLLAAAFVQASLAQVTIASDAAKTTNHHSSSSSQTISGAQVLVENTLEVGSANFPFILLSETASAADGAKGCSKLGELPYNAQSRALPAVENALNKFASTQKTFYVDNSSASDSKSTATCSTLTMSGGKATIHHGASCTTKLPTLCTNQNLNGKVTVNTHLGPFTGMRDQRGFRFRGMRYAKPVVRFAAPEPITAKWSKPVDATKFGSVCPQIGAGSDDCLFLNVFTPKLTSDKKGLLPVMFYIHGGSFTSGSGSDPSFDGSNMASRGQVVVVQINYRLGLFGFFERVDAGISRKTLPGNQGVYDMLLALKWVQQNIAAFGGDPKQVTAFGESAGGNAIRALLSMPKHTKGLFRSVISQSDPIDIPFNTPATASGLISGGAMTALNCKTIACMRKKSITDIINVQNVLVSDAIAHAPEESFMELIKPSVDGILILNNFDQLIAGKSGGITNVPLMIGTMKNEGNGFLPSLGQTTPMNEMVFGVTAEALLGYQRAMITAAYNLYPIPDNTTDKDITRDVEGVFATDYLWVCPTQYLAKAFSKTRNPIYQYTFQRAYSNVPVGDICYGKVCHGDDIAIVFASPLFMNNATAYPWTQDDAALSRMVMDRWLAFGISGGNPNPTVADGNPTWPKYDATTQGIYMFNLNATISTGGLRQPYCNFMDQAIKYDFQL